MAQATPPATPPANGRTRARTPTRILDEANVIRFRERLQRLAPDVLFATEREQDVLGRELPAPTRVLKRGQDGCLFAREAIQVDLPAADADVVDSTGAGDALAAGFLLGGTLEEAARRALGAAARCISQPGAMP